MQKIRFKDVKEGDILFPDDGFTCMKVNVEQKVRDDAGHLYIACNQGAHFLDGQVDPDGYLIGLTRGVEPEDDPRPVSIWDVKRDPEEYDDEDEDRDD